MKWMVISSAIAAFLRAVWKPVLAYLAARQQAQLKDVKSADHIRRRAQVIKERHDATIDELNDDALDQRLRDLRADK